GADDLRQRTRLIASATGQHARSASQIASELRQLVHHAEEMREVLLEDEDEDDDRKIEVKEAAP
ncbi:MAG: hypothetical protein QOI41_5862, partial [Myxococcales bacterium]|nr:hypothetical protein [Myxococcales bacterium]